MDDLRTLAAYRDLFPIAREVAFLNHAANGAIATPVAEAMIAHVREHAALGSRATAGWKVQQQRTRAKMAAFVGAAPGEIAMLTNTPQAIATIASGLDWRQGDRVVLADQEFPSNVLPWTSLARRGVETVVVRSQGGAVPAESVIAAIDGRTRVVALSWVQFGTGFRADLARIAEACRTRGALLGVDAMQGLGALPLDVAAVGIDFFAAASHKWLLGPTGVGWLYCRAGLIERVQPAIVGQKSFDRPEDGLDANAPALWTDARRFEAGKFNSVGAVGLEAALELLSEVGGTRIEVRIADLTSRLTDGLLRRGFLLAAPRDGASWSGIVAFRSDHHATDTLMAKLDAAGVVVSVRKGLIRVAPHFYNNEDDIDRLLEALP